MKRILFAAVLALGVAALTTGNATADQAGGGQVNFGIDLGFKWGGSCWNRCCTNGGGPAMYPGYAPAPAPGFGYPAPMGYGAPVGYDGGYGAPVGYGAPSPVSYGGFGY
jgi:hypothetical protein